MESILPTSEYKEYEGRAYLNPDTALNESNQFVDNLRSIQGQNNQEIAQQTYNLGTSVPSSQGGLGTNNANNLSYFTSRYQVPQTASAVADLRATAQAAALNQVLADQQAAWQKRYSDAYRSYQKSAYDKSSNSGGGSGGGNSNNNNNNTGNSSTWDGTTERRIKEIQNRYGVPDAIMTENDTHYIFENPETHEKVYISKDFDKTLYDENGNLTSEGATIIDVRQMLGM